MSDKKKKVQQKQTAKSKPAAKPAAPALSPDEALLQMSSATPIGLPADLPSQSNSRSLRLAQFNQFRRVHGNTTVQRFIVGAAQKKI